MEGFQINYTDINNLFWEYKTNLENLMSKIDYCEYSINNYINNAVFTGETADAIKSYLTDVHITMLSSLRVTAQNLLDNMSLYKAGYYDIDNSTNFKLSEEIIQAFRTTLSTNYSYTQSNTKKIQEAVSGISDISEVSTPSSNGVLELHEQIDQELSNFITSIQNYETDTVTALENSVDLLISSLNSCNEKIGLNKGAIASYTSNSFYTDKDAYALAYISELFYQQHEENKELYDKIVETEQGLKEAAEEREIQGIWEVVGGVGLLVAGGLCIYFTAGAAAPLVADIGFSIGLGTTIFGVADSEEGIQDICYGKAGDISSTAVNNLKDVVFQENEEAYYLAENIISFAASAMIPIGQASVVGKLTFRSGATIVAKEGISTVAGVGAEKVTTYYTENQTLGMFAGMIASGTTSKGLDKLDTKFNISGNVKVSGVGETSYGESSGSSAYQSGTETSRPTWRQSELDAAKDFPDYDAQKSFINGKEVPYGTKGSVRPDYYKDGYSVDIKNYNVESASGRSNLARNIEKQYYQRIENLPEGTKQSVMIDIRGQNVTDADLSALYDDIMKRTDNGVEILFKMD